MPSKPEGLYWHINYDAPAPLKFINKEKMGGLIVYHYKAHYEADQTADLTTGRT